MKVVGWKIYYDDGTEFSSEEVEPEEAPLDGIQGILEFRDNNTAHPYEGFDYYYWTGDSWAAGYLNDLERWLRRELPRLKYGRFCRNAVFLKIREDMTNWQLR